MLLFNYYSSCIFQVVFLIRFQQILLFYPVGSVLNNCFWQMLAKIQTDDYYQLQHQRSPGTMKKTKSVSVIKIPTLSNSSKKSIQLDTNTLNWPRLAVTRSTKNLTALKSTKLYSTELETDGTASNDNIKTVVKPATILRKKLTSLHQAIQNLETEILSSKQYGKNKSKDYDEELRKHEEVTNSIKTCDLALQNQQQKLREIENRMRMLEEDYSSAQMNVQQGLAEKQYCDQVLEQYKREYENQSTVVLQLFAKQAENKETRTKIKQMEAQLLQKQRTLSQWRAQIQYDLQQKISKNKLTQLRIQLMKAEQEANVYADKAKILKMRQILCILIKQSPELSRLRICDNIDEEGMEIWICKHGYFKQYEQAVINYKGRDWAKYEDKIVVKYFKILGKIEGVVNNSKLKLNRKINQEYSEQIAALRIKIMQTESKVIENEKQIVELNQKIELVFADESVAIIEHLRQTKGRYELSQIKSTLKSLKQQQKSRIQKIKQINETFNQLKSFSFEIKSVNFMNSLTQLKLEKQRCHNSLKDLQINFKNLNSLKNQIENEISLAVSKWGEISCKKQELKQLYKDLNVLNKQIRQAELVRFQEKQLRTIPKANESLMLPVKKSEIIAKTMRDTLKLRISSNLNASKNKENEQRLNTCKIDRSDIKLSKPSLNLQQNCRTRKPSMAESKDKKLQNNFAKSARDSLTAVLFSKFLS